ncbi:MAG TPA: hypothetical protein PLR32_04035 [candidate division Zixibacteria bacterium]|mgnify:CR=1 FL=1|nr:hypothetical protein [candidate division Zixibacteria bacterium]MDD4916518.1 hypothetical protein [candidate division Zixibacteria bacterium]MDM7972334.1 hypothetical protein [candidate division Zixibacteria bacterium]HOD65057.1 hypothetical protein [candidate division Zixibacteria bacterium]HOZ07095.1 hypothetical protein [candidate division Zixibacteria bacterium]
MIVVPCLRRTAAAAVACLVLALACGCAKDGGKTDGTAAARPKAGEGILRPDATTYFPLEAGSYWVYERYTEGEEEGDTTRYEVLALDESDSGWVAPVLVTYSDGDTDTITYVCGRGGLVTRKTTFEDVAEPFALLQPVDSATVGDFTYEQCPYGADSCWFLENNPERDVDWVGYEFRQGIGLVSTSVLYMSIDLVDYRIGSAGRDSLKAGNSSP